MATKANISRTMYGTALANLSSGQRAAVTKAFNKQVSAPVKAKAPVRKVAVPAAKEGYVLVEFARPSINGTTKSLVEVGTTVGDALIQAKFEINKKKEGILKRNGDLVKYTDKVEEIMYVITPGVDSSY